jgi:hypothetical protein
MGPRLRGDADLLEGRFSRVCNRFERDTECVSESTLRFCRNLPICTFNVSHSGWCDLDPESKVSVSDAKQFTDYPD